jgi:hypothetical protein
MSQISDVSFIEPEVAFNHAINHGILSSNPTAENFAGNFMYMGTYAYGPVIRKDSFKNIATRKYLHIEYREKAVRS